MRLQESFQALAAFCGKDGARGMESAHWKDRNWVNAEEGKVKWLEDSRGPVIYAVQGEGLFEVRCKVPFNDSCAMSA